MVSIAETNAERNDTGQSTFAVALFNNKSDNQPKQQTATLDELRVLLTTHQTRPDKDGKLFSPTLYKPATRRAKSNVEAVSCLVLDFDDGTNPLEVTRPIDEQGYCYIIHTTHSHTRELPKFRVVMPLAEPVSGAQWEVFWRRATAHFGNDRADKSAKDVSRIYYLPSCPPEGEGEAYSFYFPGTRLLHPDDVPTAPEPHRQTARMLQAPVPGSMRPYVRAAFDGELHAVATAQNGCKHDTLNKASFALGQFVAAGELEETPVISALLNAATANGFTETEARRTLTSGISAGKQEPRRLPEPAQPAKRQQKRQSTLTTPEPAPEIAPAAPGEFPQLAANDIPAPASINTQDKPEYDGRQLVVLTRPTWPVTSLESNAAHAHRIANYLRDILAYNKALGYLRHDGRKWHQDDKAATGACGLVAPLSLKIREEAAALLQLAATLTLAGRTLHAGAMTQAAMRLSKQAKQSEAKAFIEGALHLAASKLSVPIEKFDQKAWLLGFQNGTWARGVWREHRRNDYLMHLSPVEIDFDVDRSEWLQVLARITGEDEAFARTLQDAAAYVLSGASHLRTILWLYGPRGTGKSTFAELLQTVLDEMAVSVDPKYLQGDSARERLGAAIWNRRLAVCAEAGSQRIETELLKTLSGGDSFPVRFLHREAFTAKPRHVLMMVANDPPRMDAYDDALRDRVLALPFVHRLGEPSPLKLTGGKRIEAVRQDTNSPLVRGFAAWALEGLQRFYKAQEIYRAPVVETACTRFWRDTDPITPFWETVKDEELREGIVKGELRGRYETWCSSEGARALGRDRWTRACEAHGLYEWRSNGVRHWRK